MSRAADALRRLIRHEGPVPVSRFMAEVMAHPEHGYYTSRAPIGSEGDFTTAPEISQMFGELIGLWMLDLWRRAGAPAPFHLVELGPGRGTLLSDALRAAGLDPAFAAAMELHLVEINPGFRAAQGIALADYAPRWHDSLATIPLGPTIILANEFLDALPVRQFVRAATGWHERMVDVAGDEFTFRAAAAPLPVGLDEATNGACADGATIELGPAREAIAAEIAHRIVATGLAALVVDYGPATGMPGDTLRAVKAHREHSALADIGEADLSADVDFSALARAARAEGAAVRGPVGQGDWLRALGIEARAERLAARAGGPAVAAAVHRLCDPGEMGARFQVLALGAPGGPVPAGFGEPAP